MQKQKMHGKKEMETCVIRGASLDELRRLIEAKVSELETQGRKVVRTEPHKVRQMDLFNWSWRQTFECLIVAEN